MMIPVNKNFKTSFLLSENDFFLYKKNKKIKKTARLILKKTNGIASKVINAPRIAVKPQIKTMRCNKR